MFGWFNKPPQEKSARPQANRARPRLECLEDRTTPAVGFDPATAQLFIFQTDFNDVAGVSQDAFGNLTVSDNGIVSFFSAFQVASIVYYGAGGNDLFFNATGITSVAWGGFGADVLVGGFGQDFLFGGDLFVPGPDFASDNLQGGFGPDVLSFEPVFDPFGNPVINPFTGTFQNLDFTPDFNPFTGDVLV